MLNTWTAPVINISAYKPNFIIIIVISSRFGKEIMWHTHSVALNVFGGKWYGFMDVFCITFYV